MRVLDVVLLLAGAVLITLGMVLLSSLVIGTPDLGVGTW